MNRRRHIKRNDHIAPWWTFHNYGDFKTDKRRYDISRPENSPIFREKYDIAHPQCDMCTIIE